MRAQKLIIARREGPFAHLEFYGDDVTVEQVINLLGGDGSNFVKAQDYWSLDSIKITSPLPCGADVILKQVGPYKIEVDFYLNQVSAEWWEILIKREDWTVLASVVTSCNNEGWWQ